MEKLSSINKTLKGTLKTLENTEIDLSNLEIIAAQIASEINRSKKDLEFLIKKRVAYKL